jgi:hypothetical protein
MRVAWLCLFVAACGGPPRSDDTPDAGPDVGPVRVSVRDDVDGLAPGAGITVRFTDEAGVVVVDAVSDANGDVDVMVPPGVTATAIWPKRHHLESVVGVAWGDHLQLGAPPPAPGKPIATMVLKVPTPAGMTDVAAYGPCALGDEPFSDYGDGYLTTFVDLRPGCAPYQILVIASDGAGHDEYVAVDQIAPVDKATITLKDWQPMPLLHAQVALAAAPASLWNVERVAANKRLAMTRDLSHAGDFEGDIEAPLVGAQAEELFSYYIDQGTETVVLPIASDLQKQVIDPSSMLVPAIEGASISGGTTSWTNSGTGTADAITVSTVDQHTSATWDVLVPPGALSVTLPPLPAADAELAPTADALLTVTADETNAIADYTAVRNLSFGGIATVRASRAWTRWVHAGPIF